MLQANVQAEVFHCGGQISHDLSEGGVEIGLELPREIGEMVLGVDT